jgi:hypothetical protein
MYDAGESNVPAIPPRLAWTALEGRLCAADGARMYGVSMSSETKRIRRAGISGMVAAE